MLPTDPLSRLVLLHGNFSGSMARHGGFPKCISPKVKPATQATGAGPWAGTQTHRNPNGGKRRIAVNSTSSWSASGEMGRIK